MNHSSNNDWQHSIAMTSIATESTGAESIDDGSIANASANTAALNDHLGQLLQRLAADFQQRTLIKCRQRGHHRIRGTHFTIATYLDQSGQSLGELALRVGITQQATGKLLRDLEFGGYACSAADDQDKRSRIIKLTSAGVALQTDLAAILEEIREEYCARIGTAGLDTLEKQLQLAVALLTEPVVDLQSADATDSLD